MNLEKEIFDIMLNDIIPNRFQPREIFNDQELQELSESIKQHGVIQPIIVRKVGDKYEIIAGERRFRASQLAGKETIPALVRDIDDKEAAKIALLENLQRSNLTPIEEAKTYQTILKIDNITQDELAVNLGKSQSTIANKLRLLTLNEEVQTALLNSQISERHARSLLGLSNDQQVELLHKTLNEKLTVRQLDEEIAKMTGQTMNNDINSEAEEKEEREINMNNMSFMNQQVQNPTPIEPVVEQAPISQPSVNTMTNQQPEQVPINPMPAINSTNINPEPVEQTTQENPTTIEIPTIEPTMPNVNIPSSEPIINPEQQIQPDINIIEPIAPEPPVGNVEIQDTEPKTTNIFDKLRVDREEENRLELKTPDLTSVINANQSENVIANNNYSNIYDIRFAINNFRQAIQNTEKFGFKVDMKENDLGDKYQLVIEIDKK